MTGSQAFLIQWYLEETRLSNQKNSVTQTSHTQNGIRTLKNQYFSPQSILK